MRIRALLAAAAGFAAGCSSPPTAVESGALEGRSATTVRWWGDMRTVLRDGRTQGRVPLAEVVGPHSVGVGALAGLAAEVTIDGGTVHLAEVMDSGSPDGLRVRTGVGGEEATLLTLADVEAWSVHLLPAVPDLAALEGAVRAVAAQSGLDVAAPFPFRVEGTASALELHVLDHACPIADPGGPPPWRFRAEAEALVLVGFYAEDAPGVLTHHGQKSHVHALLTDRDVTGHLDEVRFAAGARLFLPRGPGRRPE